MCRGRRSSVQRPRLIFNSRLHSSFIIFNIKQTPSTPYNARPNASQGRRLRLLGRIPFARGQSPLHEKTNKLTIASQASGRKFQQTHQFQALPNVAYTFSMSGWYQGSGYLILAGINYSRHEL